MHFFSSFLLFYLFKKKNNGNGYLITGDVEVTRFCGYGESSRSSSMASRSKFLPPLPVNSLRLSRLVRLASLCDFDWVSSSSSHMSEKLRLVLFFSKTSNGVCDSFSIEFRVFSFRSIYISFHVTYFNFLGRKKPTNRPQTSTVCPFKTSAEERATDKKPNAFDHSATGALKDDISYEKKKTKEFNAVVN
jgi:hypothetical protein